MKLLEDKVRNDIIHHLSQIQFQFIKSYGMDMTGFIKNVPSNWITFYTLLKTEFVGKMSDFELIEKIGQFEFISIPGIYDIDRDLLQAIQEFSNYASSLSYKMRKNNLDDESKEESK